MTEKVQKIREEVERLQKRAEHNFDISLTENERQFWLGESNALTLIGKHINSLQEEPVSEDFEEALAEEWKGYIERGAATVDALEDNTQELAFAKGFYRGSQWQRQNDEHLIWQISSANYEKGKQEGKEQIMENAIEATVKVDAGGYPYIPQIELYDYDKDIPLAKEGDRYKVVLIKEDKI